MGWHYVLQGTQNATYTNVSLLQCKNHPEKISNAVIAVKEETPLASQCIATEKYWFKIVKIYNSLFWLSTPMLPFPGTILRKIHFPTVVVKLILEVFGPDNTIRSRNWTQFYHKWVNVTISATYRIICFSGKDNGEKQAWMPYIWIPSAVPHGEEKCDKVPPTQSTAWKARNQGNNWKNHLF